MRLRGSSIGGSCWRMLMFWWSGDRGGGGGRERDFRRCSGDSLPFSDGLHCREREREMCVLCLK